MQWYTLIIFKLLIIFKFGERLMKFIRENESREAFGLDIEEKPHSWRWDPVLKHKNLGYNYALSTFLLDEVAVFRETYRSSQKQIELTEKKIASLQQNLQTNYESILFFYM